MAHRYGIVLLLILTSLSFQLAAPDEDWSRMVTIVLQGLTLVAIAHAARLHSTLRRIVEIAALLATAAAVIAVAGAGPDEASTSRVTNLALVAVAPPAVVYGVFDGFRERGVTLQTMYGVLCIYLLLGLAFGAGYGAVDELSQRDFFGHGIEGNTSDFLYFSFATLTTVGYGDLTAAMDLGRSLAIVEALLGQIYLVTVVALIVGTLTRGSPPSARPG